jgi:hypothetical protein
MNIPDVLAAFVPHLQSDQRIGRKKMILGILGLLGSGLGCGFSLRLSFGLQLSLVLLVLPRGVILFLLSCRVLRILLLLLGSISGGADQCETEESDSE